MTTEQKIIHEICDSCILYDFCQVKYGFAKDCGFIKNADEITKEKAPEE